MTRWLHIRALAISCLLFMGLVSTNSYADDTLRGGSRRDSVSVDINAITINKQSPVAQAPIRKTIFSTELIQSNNTKSLDRLISENSSIYIKRMGQGALATSSFRGTASSHTQINWNGININSALQGSFDFSRIPTFFTDRVALIHGNSHQQSGTGALGGSINLYNGILDKQDNNFKVLSEYGSNNTIAEAVSMLFARGRLHSRTRLYYEQSDGDFRYQNRVYSAEPFYERRKNADYKLSGLMQEFSYLLNSGASLEANAWYMYGSRSLPQSIVTNSTITEHQKDHTLRSFIRYATRPGGNHHSTVTLSLIHDRMDYRRRFVSGSYGNEDSRNELTTLSLAAHHNFKSALSSGRSLTLSADLILRRDMADAASFSRSDASRNSLYGRVGADYQPSQRMILSGGVAIEQCDDLTMPTFNLGLLYTAIDGWLDLKANCAYNHHAPSLNDLYWTPGGNPDLKAEKGLSCDLSAVMSRSLFSTHGGRRAGAFSVELTGYHMIIDQWIMWLPTATYYWMPNNVREVCSQGLEVTSSFNYTYYDSRHAIRLSYGLSSSKVRQTDDPTAQGSVGMQLPYIPLHRMATRYTYSYRGFALASTLSFTDKRYTSADESYSADGYTLVDMEISQRLKINKGDNTITLKLRADNLFNTYYESTRFYPMPLRSFHASLLFEF